MAFASKEVTTGGNALKFYASLRLDVRRIESLKDKDGVQWGNRLAIKVAKNKMAPPFRRVEVSLKFGEGISRELDLVDAALNSGIIVQSGSWFSYKTQKLAQGKDAVVQALKADQALAALIEQDVRKVLNVMPVATATLVEDNLGEQ